MLVNDSELQGGNYGIAKENISVDGPDDSELHWSRTFGCTGSSGTPSS
ncbi:hypothetical protein GCM10023195_81480 [Actinoallomurus liliacearum]|uniref:Uncharacterized protein n=1 Tax=Actinoallomurus liliacearum TaxID=1080073 RepID=A0ABP8TZK5_9ACTN